MTLLDPQCRMTNDDSSGRWGQLKLKIGKINLCNTNATWATGSLQLHRYCNHQTHVIQNSGLSTRAWCNASCFYTVHKHTPKLSSAKDWFSLFDHSKGGISEITRNGPAVPNLSLASTTIITMVK